MPRCLDPFHVVKLAKAALDQVRRSAWNELRRAGRPEKGPLGRDRRRRLTPDRQLKRTRWALLKDPTRLSAEQAQALERLRRQRHVAWRAWALKEGSPDDDVGQAAALAGGRS
jgi:transposase